MPRTLGAKGKSKLIRVKLKNILDKFGENIEIDIANYYLPFFTNQVLKVETPKLTEILDKLEREKELEEKIEFNKIV